MAEPVELVEGVVDAGLTWTVAEGVDLRHATVDLAKEGGHGLHGEQSVPGAEHLVEELLGIAEMPCGDTLFQRQTSEVRVAVKSRSRPARAETTAQDSYRWRRYEAERLRALMDSSSHLYHRPTAPTWTSSQDHSPAAALPIRADGDFDVPRGPLQAGGCDVLAQIVAQIRKCVVDPTVAGGIDHVGGDEP